MEIYIKLFNIISCFFCSWYWLLPENPKNRHDFINHFSIIGTPAMIIYAVTSTELHLYLQIIFILLIAIGYLLFLILTLIFKNKRHYSRATTINITKY